MEDLIFVFENLETLLSFLLIDLWWIYTPVLLFLILISIFQVYTKTKYFLSLKWVLLEIRVPKEVRKSPKALENVYSVLHGITETIRWRDTFFKGKVQSWYSFEIVGRKGETRFYVRALESLKNLVEAQFYAQYPDCEITEAIEDHISSLPPQLSEEYDVFGVEFVLTKEDAYPIKTYAQFEELNPGRELEDVKRVDPLASISETFSRLNPGEYLGMQVLAKPTGDKWVKDGQAVIDKLLGKEPKKAEGLLVGFIKYIDSLLPGGAGGKEEKKEEKKKEQTPGQYEVLKSVEASMSKLGYESGIRFLYAAPKEVFQRSHVASINGAMKQFSTYNLNGFKWNTKTATLIAKQPFKKRKIRRKKMMILRNYKLRQFVVKPIILTTEELATVYHFPDIGVRSPLLPRIEAKKGEPPSELPVA